MGRGPKPAKSREAKPSVARKSLKDGGSKVRDLERRLAEAEQREAEALRREAATSEVLRVIASSPTELQPVLDAMAESAARLCAAYDAVIWRLEGDGLRPVAHHGPVGSLLGARVIPVLRGTVTGRTVLDRQTVQVTDLQAEVEEFPEGSAFARQFGHRSIVSVPLLREGVAIGAMALRRAEVQPFTEKQIELLKTFADQAVIAIENVRLFSETKEALERQTATSEILRVISSSPTDVQPVFEAVLASGVRLCGAQFGGVFRFDGELIHLVTSYQWPPQYLEALRRHFPMAPGDGSLVARAIRDRRVVQTPDYVAEARAAGGTLPLWVALGETSPRSTIAIPMMREGSPLGGIVLARAEPGLFSDQHVALLQTFADQAVIAIENVRLFNETKEALDRQTATSEILRVIAGSPTDVQPVLDGIARRSVELCDAYFANIFLVEGEMVHWRASHNVPPEANATMQRTYPLPTSADETIPTIVRERRMVVVDDAQRADQQSQIIERSRAIGLRSWAGVPLLREGSVIGVLAVARREVKPFSDKQISLLQTFADQAVIAIENVRLFTELGAKNRELTTALDRQTATSDILRVISSSPTDVKPVFDTIVQSGARLCNAVHAVVVLTDGITMNVPANYGRSSPEALAAARAMWPRPLDMTTTAGAAILTRSVVQIQDTEDPSASDIVRQAGRLLGYRSSLAVPMLRGVEAIGAIRVARQEPNRFSDAEVELLKTFADQAVIAIENVRLFTELQQKNEALTQAHAQVTEALEQQTATSEILRVISRSPTDVQPVFDTIAQSAVRLCDAVFGAVFRLEGGLIHVVAITGIAPEGATVLRQMFPIPVTAANDSTVARAIAERGVVHVLDTEAPQAPRIAREGGRVIGFRSQFTVPMLRGGEPIGAVSVSRREPGPFSDTQIALLQTFADQAVIAIENVRLFNELQTSNHELTTALDTQTATSDILRVISRSQTDVQPVFDAIVISARRLLQGYSAGLTRVVDDQIELVALTSTDVSGDTALRARFPLSLQSDDPLSQAIRDRAAFNSTDAHTDPRLAETQHAAARARGYRSLVWVPLLRHDEAVGAISVTRREPGVFTDDEIALLKTFADQAVIAIENARLLTELQVRTQELTRSVEQLTALGDVGRAVSSSLDLETVLNTIVARAVQLAGAHSGTIWEYDAAAEEFVLRITQNVEDPELRANSNARVRRGEGAVGRLAISQRPVQIPDIAHEGAYEGRLRDSLVSAGTRALLAIPLLHEDQLLGGLVVSRRTPGEFPSEVVDLLASFAAQSALALQNARLFLEIEDKSRQLEAASQHKSEFLANMSHELRTPLNAIIGFSEVLSEKMFGELNEKQEEYSKDIHASGQHLLSLINDILDLSKIEAGRMELELSDFHLPTALDSALTLVRERAGRRSIALHLSVDQRLGQIQGDERKVRQVVLNLLSNAIKFTPEGGRIEVVAMPKDGFVEVSVRDTGVGIAPEDQEAVFEEFRQVGTADKKVEGTGLGLTLCRKFVELHGGRIWVKSQVGLGSTFTFTIPVRRGE
jgi:GAF domain-containing protein